jgi:hypothetical protein
MHPGPDPNRSSPGPDHRGCRGVSDSHLKRPRYVNYFFQLLGKISDEFIAKGRFDMGRKTIQESYRKKSNEE